MSAELEALIPHATPRQTELIRAVIEHGSARAAAPALGMHHASVSAALQRARRTAARTDPARHTRSAPDGYHLHGASTLLDRGGQPVLQWVKTTRDARDPMHVLDMLREAIEDRPLKRAPEIKRPPRQRREDLLAVYPMGDPHLGMLAWAPETGADFDLQIAEAHLTRAVKHLVRCVPPAEHALICNLGDFFHSDNNAGVTGRGGHALDTDSRWAKILRVGLRTMVRCIELARRKHGLVRVINEIGNHDDHASIMLSLALEQRYHDDPCVEIDTSPARYHWYEFGRCMVGVTHGHGAKPQDLAAIMAHDRPAEWGRTAHRYWYCGHVHHTAVKEVPGAVVESFRTLAARDAWHHGQGYRAGRSMVVDVLHRDRGRVLRHEVGIEQVE